MSISKGLAWLKLRFDLGSIFLTIINFVLLIVATSSKFTEYLKWTFPHADAIFTIIAVPVAFLIMLFAGQVLIWMRYMENYANETNKRNPVYAEIIQEIRDVKEEVRALKK